VLSGKVSRDYSCVIKVDEAFETAVHELRTYFGFFKLGRTCESVLRFYSYDGSTNYLKKRGRDDNKNSVSVISYQDFNHSCYQRCLNLLSDPRSDHLVCCYFTVKSQQTQPHDASSRAFDVDSVDMSSDDEEVENLLEQALDDAS
jgi:hypothetical protein